MALLRRPSPDGGYEYVTTLKAMGFEDVPGVRMQSHAVATLAEAFGLLDDLAGGGWHRLHPLHVHPAYASEVMREVELRGSNTATERWRRAC